MKFFQSIGAKTIGKLTAIGLSLIHISESRGLGDVYKRQPLNRFMWWAFSLC